jgi:SpoVK/Ycf46/Vps4 family AAA+-type ATPase
MAEAYFTLAHKLAPSIIFIDEIDCLFPRQRGAGEHEATAALRSQFLSLWDGILSPRNGRASSGHVVLIGATNRAENIDEAILRRMPFSIEVPMPDEAGRADVLTRMLRDEAMARELDISALARECAGYSGSDLEALCSTAAMRPLDELLAREKAAEGAVDGGRAGNEEVPEGRGAAVGVAQPPGVQEEARGSGSGDGGVRDAGSAGAAETSGGEGEASALGVEETNGQRGIALASDIESELCAPTNGNVAGVNAGRAASSAGAAETSGGQGGVSASGTLEANGKKGVSSASGTAASNGKGKVAAVTDTTNGKGGVLLGKAVASAHGTEEELRPLTMDDFRAAMLVVRSSGNRFSRPPALVGASEHTGDVDWDLYD